VKAAFIDRYGDNRVLRVGEQPAPQPGPHDLLVQVLAASVNPIDTKIRQGKTKLLLPYDFPLILGNDLSGVVLRTGEAVQRFRAGDEIYARLDKKQIGAFAEMAVVGEADAARKPTSSSHEQAASLPLVGLTSWQALVEIGQVSRGQKVLIHAGAGGVGSFAIQLAKYLGAHVTTTASERNLALVERLGADQVVDYRKERFEDNVHDLDFVFDTLAGDTLLRSLNVVRRGGVVVSIASLPDATFARGWGLPTRWVWLLGLLMARVTRRARARGVRFEYLFMHPSGEQLERIARLVEAGTIVPVIDRVFPLEKTAEAMAYVESGQASGKVIIQMASATETVAAARAGG
jgi:alcohol dehydrogenase